MRRALAVCGVLGCLCLLMALWLRPGSPQREASGSGVPASTGGSAVGSHPGPSTAAISSNGPVASEILVETDESLVPQGRYVFERNCQVCHGKWGDGRGEMAVGMKPRPRKLTSGIFKFRSTPSGFLPTDADLERTIRRGIPNTSMPTFAHLTSRDVEAVIAYLKTLSSRWRHPENHSDPIPPEPEPEWLYRESARAPHAEVGRKLFMANCSACHGEDGSGTGPASLSLEDGWGDPIPPADLRGPAIKSGVELKDVYRALATGLDGTPMPSFRDGLSDADRWDLVAYIAEMRRRAAGPATGTGLGDSGVDKPGE